MLRIAVFANHLSMAQEHGVAPHFRIRINQLA
jgi:hypothetical protein